MPSGGDHRPAPCGGWPCMNCPEGSGWFATESITDRPSHPRRSVRYLDLLLPRVDRDKLPTDSILAQTASTRGGRRNRDQTGGFLFSRKPPYPRWDGRSRFAGRRFRHQTKTNFWQPSADHERPARERAASFHRCFSGLRSPGLVQPNRRIYGICQSRKPSRLAWRAGEGGLGLRANAHTQTPVSSPRTSPGVFAWGVGLWGADLSEAVAIARGRYVW